MMHEPNLHMAGQNGSVLHDNAEMLVNAERSELT